MNDSRSNSSNCILDGALSNLSSKVLAVINHEPRRGTFTKYLIGVSPVGRSPMSLAHQRRKTIRQAVVRSVRARKPPARVAPNERGDARIIGTWVTYVGDHVAKDIARRHSCKSYFYEASHGQSAGEEKVSRKEWNMNRELMRAFGAQLIEGVPASSLL